MELLQYNKKYYRSGTEFLVAALQSEVPLGPARQEVRVRNHHCHQTRLQTNTQ